MRQLIELYCRSCKKSIASFRWPVKTYDIATTVREEHSGHDTILNVRRLEMSAIREPAKSTNYFLNALENSLTEVGYDHRKGD